MNGKKITLFGSLLIFTALLTGGCGIQAIPKANNNVEAAWAEVLNQYQRRADLVPNLVKTVKAYAKQEKETLESVVKARAQATNTNVSVDNLNPETLNKFQAAQSGLSSALSRLMVVVERYPDLKANQNFRDLQVQLEGTENRIAIARRRYIDSVRGFNNYVTVVPYSWVNSMFYHFDKKPQFAIENESTKSEAPEVDL